MHRCLALLLCLFWTGAPQAQPAPDRLDILQSHWHADRADRALRAGDRTGAVVAALHGIPATPTAPDEATYAAAFEALFRAVASRSFQTDLQSEQVVTWSPDGTRAISESAGGGRPHPRSSGTVLWNPITGTAIAELLPPRGYAEGHTIGYYGFVSTFSADSTRLALAQTSFDASDGSDGTVSVFDAVTGALIAQVPGDVFLGFSSGGDLIAVQSIFNDVLQLIDTGTWQVVHQLTTSQLDGFSIVAVLADRAGGFRLMLTGDWDDGGAPDVRYARIDRSGWQGLADLGAIPGFEIGNSWAALIGSVESDHALVMTDRGEGLVLGPDGQMVAAIPDVFGSYSSPMFVRGGQAIAFHDGFWGDGDNRLDHIRVFDLSGTPLVPQAMDLVPFLDRMTNRQGYLIGTGVNPQVVGPGRMTATGVGLHDQIWPLIPEDIRARIEADRITRP